MLSIAQYPISQAVKITFVPYVFSLPPIRLLWKTVTHDTLAAQIQFVREISLAGSRTLGVFVTRSALTMRWSSVAELP